MKLVSLNHCSDAKACTLIATNINWFKPFWILWKYCVNLVRHLDTPK
jgi:hypothetical protein